MKLKLFCVKLLAYFVKNYKLLCQFFLIASIHMYLLTVTCYIC